MTESPGWQDRLYDLLRRNNITQFAYVPDAGHRVLIDRSLADAQVRSVALTSEEEGVALLAGADLGGARGVLLMQSSGAGNCINMLSLIKGGRFPFLTLVSMRGDFGEGNPWQYPMGQAVEPVLSAMGVICLRVERAEEVVPTVEAALTMVFQSGHAVAVLLTQKLLGAKQFQSASAVLSRCRSYLLTRILFPPVSPRLFPPRLRESQGERGGGWVRAGRGAFARK
jgi:sulfopyruvate decarboxylase alpha subunit